MGDYLKKVHGHLIEAIIEKCGGSDILDVTPIEYWITVPAIWSDEAKIATRQAAMFAGFGSRPIDETIWFQSQKQPPCLHSMQAHRRINRW